MSKINKKNPDCLGYILISIDNPETLDSLCKFLHEEGYGTFICNSYNQLLEADKMNITAALIDISAGRQSTIHAIELIKQTNPSANIPVIVTSENPNTEDIIFALNAGANDYIVRPFSNLEFFTRLRTLTK